VYFKSNYTVLNFVSVLKALIPRIDTPWMISPMNYCRNISKFKRMYSNVACNTEQREQRAITGIRNDNFNGYFILKISYYVK